MFDIPSIRIGRIFGIPIEVNLSWIVVFVLLTASLRSGFLDLPGAHAASSLALYLAGAATALLFFSSVLAHEVSHSVVTKLEGGSVEKITLFIFGGVAQVEDEPKTPGREFLMAAAGPGMSLVIAGVAFLIYKAEARGGAPWWVLGPLDYIASVNLILAVFNLLPGFPLDGGRVFRSVLWGLTGDLLKATKWATRSGQVIGWGMVVLSLTAILNGNTNLVWFGLVGWFIAWLAGASYRQQVVRSSLEGRTAESVMSATPEYVDGGLSLERFADEHLLGGQHTRYPVMDQGTIVGIATLSDLKGVPRSDWPVTRLLDITDRDLEHLTVAHDLPAETVMTRLVGSRPGALLVTKDGRMVGIVTRADILSAANAGVSRQG